MLLKISLRILTLISLGIFSACTPLQVPTPTISVPTVGSIENQQLEIATPIAETPLPAVMPASTELDVTTTQSEDCSEMIIVEHRLPSLGQTWDFNPISEDRVLTLWSNHRDPNLNEYKFFLPAGQSASFMSGGGVEYRAKPGCEGIAEVIFDRDIRELITLEQYQNYIDNGVIP